MGRHKSRPGTLAFQYEVGPGQVDDFVDSNSSSFHLLHPSWSWWSAGAGLRLLLDEVDDLGGKLGRVRVCREFVLQGIHLEGASLGSNFSQNKLKSRVCVWIFIKGQFPPELSTLWHPEGASLGGNFTLKSPDHTNAPNVNRKKARQYLLPTYVSLI